MIDELLARLRQWRAVRDIEESLDLTRKLTRLEREYNAVVKAQEDYDREHAAAQRTAYGAALAEAGIEIVPTTYGWPEYRTADGKVHLGRPPAVYARAVPYDPPPGPAPELRREIELTAMQVRGLSRGEAEAIQAKEEARLADIGEWAKQPSALVGYEYRPDWRNPPTPTHAIADRKRPTYQRQHGCPTGHHGRWDPEYVTETEPSADDIVVVGPVNQEE